MRIAVNLIRDHARNRRLQFWKRAQTSAVDLGSRRPVACRMVAFPPESGAIARQQLAAVWNGRRQPVGEAADGLPAERFVEDMDLLEIAAATGMKEGTVKVHLFRSAPCPFGGRADGSPNEQHLSFAEISQ